MTGRGCAICGRQPAADVVVRRHVGMIVLQRFYKFDGPLCRNHGTALIKEWLARTFVQGWWGVTSFFINIFVVFSNLYALSKVNALSEIGKFAVQERVPPSGVRRATKPLRISAEELLGSDIDERVSAMRSDATNSGACFNRDG